MTPIEDNPRFVYIADQIENHNLAISYLVKQLQSEFPAPAEYSWGAMFNNRPILTRKYDAGLSIQTIKS